MTWSIELKNEAATIELGKTLSHICRDGAVIYLDGQLGAGKTTLCRGVLSGFGHSGAVKSPTYTLVEPYELDERVIYHFDLYRLGDPEELEFMGIRDYFTSTSICLVEWPSKGEGVIPEPDLLLSVQVHGSGRILAVSAGSAKGSSLLEELQASYNKKAI